MQPFFGRLEPRLEAVPVPALRLDQYNPGGLNEQNAQVAIAAFRNLAEDGAVAGRDLLGDEPQPGGEVAAFRERIAAADCSYHRAGDDWPNPRHAHQPLTTRVSACKVLDHSHHARRQDLGRCGEDAWQLNAQEAQALPNGNTALQ